MRVTQPFDASTLLSIDPELCRRVGFTQGHESFDLAQDREPVERLVEWQMGVFRQPQSESLILELISNLSRDNFITSLAFSFLAI